MAAAIRIALTSVACAALVALVTSETHLAARPSAPSQPAAKPAPRYASVQPILARHCGSCHDARIGSNPRAQAVFEMTSYPFATQRPASLLADLRAMVPRRGALSAADKALLLAWLDGGALDDAGKPPIWRR